MVRSSRSLDALDMESSLQDVESYWNDPLMNILMQPSQEVPTTPSPMGAVQSMTANRAFLLALEDDSTSLNAYPPQEAFSKILTALRNKLESMASNDIEKDRILKEWLHDFATDNKLKAQV